MNTQKIFTNVVILTCFSPALSADVTLDQSVSIEARGLISVLESNKTVLTRISDDQGRIEEFNGPRQGQADKAMIVNLDQQMALLLYPARYQYEEKPLSDIADAAQRDIELIEQMPQNGPDALPIGENGCQWANPAIDLDRTGEKQRIGGITAEQYLVTMASSCEVPETKQECDVTWVLDYWNARRMPGDDEVLAFRRKLADQFATPELLAMSDVIPRGLLALFEHGWEEVMYEADGLRGFPVKTVLSLHIGGKNCRTRSDEEITQDSVWSKVKQDSIQATKQSAANVAGNVVAGEVLRRVGGNLGGVIASSAAGVLTRDAASGAMNKEKQAKSVDVGDESLSERVPGQVQIFRITTELNSVNDTPLSAERFKPPKGWENLDSN